MELALLCQNGKSQDLHIYRWCSTEYDTDSTVKLGYIGSLKGKYAQLVSTLRQLLALLHKTKKNVCFFFFFFNISPTTSLFGPQEG